MSTQAAEVLLEEPLLDGFESEDEDVEVDEDDVVVAGVDFDDEAGELLDEEPRLSLR